MKRIFLFAAALVMLAGLCACRPVTQPAQEATSAPTAEQTAEPAMTDAPDSSPTAVPISENGYLLLLDTTADLDGDGAMERVYIESDDNEWTYVTVTKDGRSVSDKVCYCYAPPVCMISAIWSDGNTKQIVLAGDTGSDDFITMIYAYENGALTSQYIDGCVKDIPGDGTMRIEGSVDILGTYGAVSTYTIHQDMTAERSSDYEIVGYDGFDQERALTVQKDGLTAKTLAGEILSLPAGTTLVLRSTNLTDSARCSTSLGEDVTLAVSQPADDWGWYVDGVPEADWFGELLYAG